MRLRNKEMEDRNRIKNKRHNITILLRVMLHMYAAIEAKYLNEGRADASEIVLWNFRARVY